MSRTKWTTILTIAAVATLLATLATPVSAKKPDKPAPPAEFVNVTMEILGDNDRGVATDCNESGVLVMKQESASLLRIDWADANTDVWMDLEKNLEGEGIDPGCHGGLVYAPDGADVFTGYFILAARRGDTLELTSRFDYTWDYETETKGKREPRIHVVDLYEINADLHGVDDEPFDWAASGEQVVTGNLELSHFTREAGWEVLSSMENVKMAITIHWPPTG